MPTGGGKSLTFQVPALCMDGLCIVVTPLIALMKDQADNLLKLGVQAAAVHSGMSREEIRRQLESCVVGRTKFLYVSPERLGTDLFLSQLPAMKVCLLVVDESHCISQWGYDFRPAYLSIAAVRSYLPDVPVLALTATATPEVQTDIQEKLHFRAPHVFRQSFLRTNLSYVVRQTEEKSHTLVYILRKLPGSAIVYVRSRKHTQEIAAILQQAGISAHYFHAGLSREEKNLRQDKWKSGEYRIIVSTNAFGMGIDKPDVRLVIHLDMPGSLEEYYQEAGRAGRDGQRAYAVVLYSASDTDQLKMRFANEFPGKDFIRKVYQALGNYYQLSAGDGKDSTHPFDLSHFCSACTFPLLPTHHALKILELSGYIEYTEEIDCLPHQKTSLIVYTRPREEAEQLHIPPFAYQERKERAEKRLVPVLHYISETRICRNRMLLSYFGEEKPTDCRICDVCLAQHQSELKNHEFNAIRQGLLTILSDGQGKEIEELVYRLAFNEDKCLKVIRFLADNDGRFILEEGYLKLKTR